MRSSAVWVLLPLQLLVLSTHAHRTAVALTFFDAPLLKMANTVSVAEQRPFHIRQTLAPGQSKRVPFEALPSLPQGAVIHAWRWQLQTPLASLPPWLTYIAPWEGSHLFAMNFHALDYKQSPDPVTLKFAGEVVFSAWPEESAEGLKDEAGAEEGRSGGSSSHEHDHAPRPMPRGRNASVMVVPQELVVLAELRIASRDAAPAAATMEQPVEGLGVSGQFIRRASQQQQQVQQQLERMQSVDLANPSNPGSVPASSSGSWFGTTLLSFFFITLLGGACAVALWRRNKLLMRRALNQVGVKWQHKSGHIC